MEAEGFDAAKQVEGGKRGKRRNRGKSLPHFVFSERVVKR